MDVPVHCLIFVNKFRCRFCTTPLRVILRVRFLAAAMVLGAGSAVVMRPEPLWARVALAAAVAGVATAGLRLTQAAIVGAPGRPLRGPDSPTPEEVVPFDE